ncbi:hypothetical protein T552_02177 [Pneumocystis carinii B80]|uniref:Uncharacterized protein n=1 Tax=Pneumocystis carinii (strain B80) TaxID=1408658 RepID=A0A0W4ZH89_PNEC8|nr:hypothetical protein T552_02177 [Pneumocystis carinii B80]KTW27737.1 hypothetical protein T552_02177 [Pneumocystis carinii B80]
MFNKSSKGFIKEDPVPPDYGTSCPYNKGISETIFDGYTPLLDEHHIIQENEIPEDFKYGTTVNQCDISIRMDFVRKVYSILFVQIIASVLISGVLTMNKMLREYIVSNPMIIFFSMFGSIGTLLFLSWKRRSCPLNFYLLALFTLFESFTIGTIVSFYNSNVVLEALLITTGIFLGLTLFTWQNRYDFSSIGGYLYFGLIVFLSGGLVSYFFPYNRTFDLLYAMFGALIFIGYILYDTSNLMKHLSPEEYIVGAVSLYIDIVNLFLQILNLIAKLDGGDNE